MRLRSCKYCGARPLFAKHSSVGVYGEELGTFVKVVCPKCNFEVVPFSTDYDDAASLWNIKNKTKDNN